MKFNHICNQDIRITPAHFRQLLHIVLCSARSTPRISTHNSSTSFGLKSPRPRMVFQDLCRKIRFQNTYHTQLIIQTFQTSVYVRGFCLIFLLYESICKIVIVCTLYIYLEISSCFIKLLLVLSSL